MLFPHRQVVIEGGEGGGVREVKFYVNVDSGIVFPSQTLLCVSRFPPGQGQLLH